MFVKADGRNALNTGGTNTDNGKLTEESRLIFSRVGQAILAGTLPADAGPNQIAINVHTRPGDEVLCEMTPYDLTKGRITYRFK